MSKRKLPVIYYDSRTGNYWMKLGANGDQRFLSLNTSSIRLHLRHAGLTAKNYVDGSNLDELEFQLLKSQLENHVDFAGPLAGHKSGLMTTASGMRCLVTAEPRLITPKKGDFPFIERFIGELLGPDQCPYVLGWLKTALAGLSAGDFRPGQLLALAGPSACGKSLFQAMVTEILGGRVAKPYRYMIGETAFNVDLASAEHLCIEDENASTDIRARRKFGASVKDFTVNTWLSVHAKGHTAVTLPTFKRLTLSVNDEPENLLILPPLDPSIEDKLMLFKCGKADVGEDRQKTWNAIQRELPAFIHFVGMFRIPLKLRDDRFGVTAYQHPALVDVLTTLAPETRLLGLIDSVLFPSGDEVPWSGTSEELEQELRGSKWSYAVERLATFQFWCGTYLGRLANRLPERFVSKKLQGKTRWVISPEQREPVRSD